jgi:hypothetical protein
MLSAAAALPAVQAMLEAAQRVLGYDLLELCTKGEWTRERCYDRMRVFLPAKKSGDDLLKLCMQSDVKGPPAPQPSPLPSTPPDPSPCSTPPARPSGPPERLDDTRVAQPALFVAGLAAVEMLRRSEPTRGTFPSGLCRLWMDCESCGWAVHARITCLREKEKTRVSRV